ncbi:MAG TPA: PIN domain-containing protein [Abditibacterium sp.]|jgi:predicted nucleic acid-binding protein
MLQPIPTLTALLDANVLYPAPLRDVLMHLATARLFRARWSAEIHEEWIRNLLRNRPDLSRETLEGTRDMMLSAVPDGLVTRFEHLIPDLALPDADDRHVLAAAVVGGADTIVTFNLKDFPKAALEPFGLVAQTPDEFIHELLDANEDRVILAIKRQRTLLSRPPKSVEAHLETLLEQKLPRTVARLRTRASEL